jgi:Spy/CpxP family protein refolding chaperone
VCDYAVGCAPVRAGSIAKEEISMILRVVLAGLLVSGLVLAQSKGGGGGGGGQSGMPRGGIQKETNAQQIGNRLKLSKEQGAQVEEIFSSIMKENVAIIQAAQKSRTNLATALVNGKKGADLEPFVNAMNEAQFQMTGVEVQAFRKILEILKPNQTAKAPEAFELMADLFIPQQPAGRGGMGRGGR